MLPNKVKCIHGLNIWNRFQGFATLSSTVQSYLRIGIKSLTKTSDSQLGIHIQLGAREQLKGYTKRQILLKVFFGDTQILKG
jgi:hypothetical protein